jgi:hypothetical protein
MFSKFTSLFGKNKKQQNEEDLAQIKSNLEGLTTDEIIGEQEMPIAKSIITRQTSFSKILPDPDNYHAYLQSILREQYEEYINFLYHLTVFERVALKEPSADRTTEDNELIEGVFRKIPPLKHSFYAYRCYRNNVSIADLQANPNNGVISSVTIRASYADYWCKKHAPGDKPSYEFQDDMPKQSNRNLDEKGDLIVCILIPKGTKIIPLIGIGFEHKEQEFETILSSHSKLYYTGIQIRSKNIPLFVCVNEENLIENTDEMKDMNKNILTEYFIESAIRMDPSRRSSFIESFSRIPREKIIKKREAREREEKERIEKEKIEKEEFERVHTFMENERIKAEEAEIEAEQQLQENISANYRSLTMFDGPRGGKKYKSKRHKKRKNKTKRRDKTKRHANNK